MKKSRVFAASAILLMLTQCAEQGGPLSKQQTGTVLGALGGAAAGSQFGGGMGRVGSIAIGTLLGGALGSSIGASLDRTDMNYYNRTSQNTLESTPTGHTNAWQNPDSGVSGTITPTRTYNASGNYCREYTQTITVGGKKEQSRGNACRQPDGTWRVIE